MLTAILRKLVKLFPSLYFNSSASVFLKYYKKRLSLVFILSFNLGDLSPCLKMETIDRNYSTLGFKILMDSLLFSYSSCLLFLSAQSPIFLPGKNLSIIFFFRIQAQSSQYLGFPFTKDQPLTSQTYDLPFARNISNPHTSCSNSWTILLHMNFSSGERITGYLTYFPY